MTNTSYLFLAVGNNLSLHNQAKYAIISLLAYLPDTSNIFVLTDFPEHYTWFCDSISCLFISSAQITQWKGQTNYFFRAKIKAMQHVFAEINGNLVFLDADTVCLQDLYDFERRLTNGDFFMHTKEFLLSCGPTKTAKQMWRVGKNRFFGALLIDENTFMWNSGVIAIPAGSCHYLSLALEACDAMCASKMRLHFVEQLALGLSLSKSQRLCEAKQWFLHYWGNKEEWQKTLIEPFLLKIQELSISEARVLMKEVKHRLCAVIIKKPNFFKRIRKLILAICPFRYASRNSKLRT